MFYQDYIDWYAIDVDPKEYYQAIAAASGRDPQATARTRDADGTVPESYRGYLFNISRNIRQGF